MQQPPPSVNGGGGGQQIRYPGPPAPRPSLAPTFPTTPGKPGGYMLPAQAPIKPGGPMNGPPAGPPPRPTLPGSDVRPPLVNGQPGPPLGPPAWPPSRPPPRPPGASPSRPYLPPPSAQIHKPPTPTIATATTASSAPLLNGYQRPSPPIVLPEALSSHSSSQSSRQPSPQPPHSLTPQLDRMERQPSPLPGGWTTSGSSSLNEVPYPVTSQANPSHSQIGEGSSKMSPLVSPRMSPVPATTASVNGAPTTVPQSSNTVSSDSPTKDPQLNASVVRTPKPSPANSVGSVQQSHSSNTSVVGSVPAPVSGHYSVASSNTQQPVKPPGAGDAPQRNSDVPPGSSASGSQSMATVNSAGSRIVPPSPVNMSSAPQSSTGVSQTATSYRAPVPSPVAAPVSMGSRMGPPGASYASPASGSSIPVRPIQSPSTFPVISGPPMPRPLQPPVSMGLPLPSGASVQPPSTLMGPPSTSMGPPPTSMGPPPTSMGPPPTSMGPPPTRWDPRQPDGTPANFDGTPANFDGTPANFDGTPANFDGTPTNFDGTPTNPMGPPPTSIGPPPSSLGPPSSSVGTSTSFGAPPMMMGAPSPSGLPQARMGAPPTSVGPPPSSLRPPPPVMGPSTSMGLPPASMGLPPASMGLPPTSIRPPPPSMGPPPTSMGAPPTSAGYRPTVGPPPTGPSLASTHKGPIQKQLPGQGPLLPPQPHCQPPYGSIGPNMNQLSQHLGGLSVTHDGWNKGWGRQQIDLLQNRQILPPNGVEPPKPVLAQEYLPNCSPDIFRCTLTRVPETKSVLQKSRLPFGILIHPFKDLEHLPVVSCNTIVRCRSCRTYINPFVVFKGERRWECNLCFRVNELPEEFQYDPVSRTYGDPSRRPEVREATIEFIAPQEYMLRPPQPATYLWVLDVSRQAVDTGYLKVVCDTLLTQLDKIPGDRRTLVGFITFSNNVQFYLLGEDQKHVQMLEVGEMDDVFVPNPEDLLVNLEQSRNLVEELLATLPEAHSASYQTQSALGPALLAASKLIGPIGGRITVMTTTLPTVGPGALKAREDPNQRAGKDIQNMGPATDFYKKLALDCSGQQVAVDLFALNAQYIDLATLTGMSKFSGGCIHHFPNFHVTRNPTSVTPFVNCLSRYITRKIGFEAVMRIRATRGLAITNFHGNFFVRSTDLLSLPNINPDAGFGMQVNIEEPLHSIRTACFQAALLYTSSRGERRIRVHTLCLPVSPNQHEIVTAGDQQAIIGLLTKMGVDRCLSSSLSDARDALVNACVDAFTAYRMGLSSPAHGALEAPPALTLMPLCILAVVKSIAFRGGLSTKLDDRLFAMCELKTLPLRHLMTFIYPDLYAIHTLSEKGAINIDDQVVPQPSRLHLSAERLERSGSYLMDTGPTIYIYVRSGVSPSWVEATLGVPSYAVIPQPLYEDALPALDTTESVLLRNFVAHLQRNKPYHAPVVVLKEDNPTRMLFIQHLVDDRTEGAHSYVEFLQFLKTQIK